MGVFKDKVVLITGGGTGIGRAAAELFVSEGAKVMVTGRRPEPLRELANEHAPHVEWLNADVTEPGEAARILGRVAKTFGRLDILVNNAGTFAASPLSEVSDEEVARVFAVNVFGPIAVTRHALPHLTESRGVIINVSTTLTRGVMAGTGVYAASKSALEQVTRVLAAEVGAAGVRVNAIAPGLTATDMSAPFRADDEARSFVVAQTPFGRVGEPIDVARAIAMAARPEASWVTGQVIQASGGFMA